VNRPETLFCSTSMTPLTGDADQLVGSWERLCSDAAPAGLVVDARLGDQLQRDVLRHARSRGLSCPMVVHPLLGPRGLPAAAPSSVDRDERRAAVEQLLLSAERAQQFGVSRVLLLPGRLPLSCSRETLLTRHSRGEELRDLVAQLDGERRARSAAAIDALCLVLDPTLRRLESLGVELVLPRPAPWPDQVPDGRDVERLRGLFAGAPLTTAFVTDWWHVGQETGVELDGERDRPATGEPLSVADACGLVGGLPLGTGELERSRLQLPASCGPLVLTADASHTPRPAEISAASSLLRSWPATPG